LRHLPPNPALAWSLRGHGDFQNLELRVIGGVAPLALKILVSQHGVRRHGSQRQGESRHCKIS
jgi:hypothetical protein